MTKIEISAVHSKSVFNIFVDSLILVLNSQASIMETLNDPDKLKQVNPKQLQRIVAYQTWFNESFEKNAIKERTKLEKKQEKDFQKVIKTLEEVSTVYEEKKVVAEELQSSRLAREELALLEEMMPKLGTNKNVAIFHFVKFQWKNLLKKVRKISTKMTFMRAQKAVKIS